MLMLLKSIKEKSFDTEDGGYQLTFQWSDLSEGHRRFFSLKTVLSRVGPTTPPPSPALVFGASQQQSPLPTESSPPPPLSPLTTHLSSTLQDEVGRIINFIRPLYRFVTLAESPTPWLVFIDRTGSEEYSCCNGVLIGQNKVLTSASCVEFGALIDEEKKDSLPGTLEVYSSHPENAVDDNINIRFKVLQIVNYPVKKWVKMNERCIISLNSPTLSNSG